MLALRPCPARLALWPLTFRAVPAPVAWRPLRAGARRRAASARNRRRPLGIPLADFGRGSLRRPRPTLFCRVPLSLHPRSDGRSECSAKRSFDPAGRLSTTTGLDIVAAMTSGSSVSFATPRWKDFCRRLRPQAPPSSRARRSRGHQKKRAQKLEARGKTVHFKELLRMEPDGGTNQYPQNQ